MATTRDALDSRAATVAQATLTTSAQTLLAVPATGNCWVIEALFAIEPSTAASPETVTFTKTGDDTTALFTSLPCSPGSGFVIPCGLSGLRLPVNCGLTVIGGTGGLSCIACVIAKQSKA